MLVIRLTTGSRSS